MRTSPTGRTRRLRLAAGAALVIPAVALATAFGAGAQAETGDLTPGGTASPTATPSPTASPSASESPTPAPGNPPAAAPKPSEPKKAGEWDADGALALHGPDHLAPGKVEKLTFTVTSTKATTYRVDLNEARGLEIVKTDGHGDWRIGTPTSHPLTATTSVDSATPGPIDVYVRAIDGPAWTTVVTAQLLTNLTDPEQGNNKVAQKFTVDGSGTVRGRVWHDKNRNGLQDVEPGVSNVPVALFAVPTADEVEFVAEAETDAEGRYRFAQYPLGEYIVVMVAPDGGWDFTKPKVGTNEYQDSDVSTELEQVAVLRASAKRGIVAGARAHLEEDEELRLAFSGVFKLDGMADVVVDAGLVKGAVPSPSTSPTVTATPAPGGGGSLPTTGAALTGLLGAGVLLIGGGIGITVLARRRRSGPGTA